MTNAKKALEQLERVIPATFGGRSWVDHAALAEAILLARGLQAEVERLRRENARLTHWIETHA